jgi:formylglycine-generating enzyme required for sulfatase activity
MAASQTTVTQAFLDDGRRSHPVSDIFICYSETDRAIATRLEQRLREQGWSVFMDVQTHVGKRWHKEIEKELQAARAVVVLWSARSRESDFVLEEADYGRRKEILFPAFIERVEFPYGFGRLQTAELIGWSGDEGHPGLAKLLKALNGHLKSHEPMPGPAGGPQPDPVVTTKPVQPARARALAPGQTFRDRLTMGAEGPLMVVIPAGRFLMGSPAYEPERRDLEGPQHEVRIATPFATGVYAVTFDEYELFCEDMKLQKPKDQGWGRGRGPVINVSWEAARAYCAWLGEQTGHGYRLPSEAEWEYACRAGTETPFHFGARLTTDQANFYVNSTYNGPLAVLALGRTVPVGSFPPNAFGLYDMHGNVCEWCQDAWHDRYEGAPSDGTAWKSGEYLRVLRGGSWSTGPSRCRAAHRTYAPASYSDVGFRVCRSAPIE